MASIAERVSALEERFGYLRRDMDDLRNMIAGGGDIEYERSIRGRLHTVENHVAALLHLRAAGRLLLGRTSRVVLGVVAIAAAAAPYVLYFATR